MELKPILPLVREAAAGWSEDKVPRLAAALAYYTLFSIAPLVVVVIAIAGFFFGREAATGAMAAQIRDTVGPEAAEVIQGLVRNASQPSHGIPATIISLATLLAGAMGVFLQLQDALNTIWGVQPKPGRGLMQLVRDQFLSFTMVLGTGFLLLVSLALSAGIAAVGAFMSQSLPLLAWLGPALDILLSVVVFTVLIALIYKVLPQATISWRDVWTGAAITAVLFTLGKFLIGLYLGRSSVTSVYGAAGSLVVLLLWIYYSAQILFFGAEFTKAYARRCGSRVVPEPDAVAVTEEARAQQGMALGVGR